MPKSEHSKLHTFMKAMDPSASSACRVLANNTPFSISLIPEIGERDAVITNRTILENRQNVLEQNIIEESHKMIMNATSWPLLLGVRCAASQYFASIPVITQNGPSRSLTSSLKSWQCWVSMVVVIWSFRPWWSTKIKFSKVEIRGKKRSYKKLYLEVYSTHRTIRYEKPLPLPGVSRVFLLYFWPNIREGFARICKDIILIF